MPGLPCQRSCLSSNLPPPPPPSNSIACLPHNYDFCQVLAFFHSRFITQYNYCKTSQGDSEKQPNHGPFSQWTWLLLGGMTHKIKNLLPLSAIYTDFQVGCQKNPCMFGKAICTHAWIFSDNQPEIRCRVGPPPTFRWRGEVP